MPDEHDDDLEPDEPESSVIRDLRKQLKAKETEASEVKALRQELAFSKAGSEFNEAQRKAIIALHGDEAVTAETIATHAESLGLVKPKAEEPQVPAEEQQAHQRMQEATATAQPADGTPESLEDRIAKAQNSSELRQIMADAGVGWNQTEV